MLSIEQIERKRKRASQYYYENRLSILARKRDSYVPRKEIRRSYQRCSMQARREMPHTISTPIEGYHKLCEDLLTLAVRDWKRVAHAPCQDRARYAARQALLDYFLSNVFELYCDMACVNPDAFLEKLGIRSRYIGGEK